MPTRTELNLKLTRKKAQLETANITYEELLADGTESYKFDSGDGSQSAKKRKLQELKEQIDELESDISTIERRLSGRGLTNVGLRRKGGCFR